MSSTACALKLENVLYEKKGPIAYVTINRPKVLNALNQAVFAELKAAFEDAREDANVRGVILTGSGDKAFAAGADIAEMSSYTAAQGEEATRRAQGVTELIDQNELDALAGALFVEFERAFEVFAAAHGITV